MELKVEFLDNLSQVKREIKKCEGRHVQQISYSSYHDALTQTCFNCRRVRTCLKLLDIADKDLQESADKDSEKKEEGK